MVGSVNHDDRRLIREAVAGDTAAFGELVRRYQDRLYNIAYRVVGNPDDAADVVQDAFVNAFQALPSFKGDSEFFTWLYRIAFNTAISQKRKKRPTASIDGGTGGRGRSGESRGGWDGRETFDPPDESAGSAPDATLSRTEDERVLAEAIAKLSDEHRAVLVLKDIDGEKYEDIAAALAIPIGTVRSRLHRARLELRQLIAPQSVGLDANAAGPLEGVTTPPPAGTAAATTED